jgi:hypothetical protein
MRLIQFKTAQGQRRVARVGQGGDVLTVLADTETVYGLAREAVREGRPLAHLAAERATDERVDYGELVDQSRLLAPLDHPDPAHCLVTGTGLTHLGSADARDKMHQQVEKVGEQALTDSMKMFKLGLEGGKPPAGQVGVQPEWFYKGDGSCVVAPEQPLAMPDFALDGGEEPEIFGLYLIADDGTPWRVGFAVGNEFSDHVMERQNYLYLAHSKLRACSFGPELLLGELPQEVRGSSRILRGGKVVWEKAFLSGEANMSHTLHNLEYHHFKYGLFRRPGDVHVHSFGTATLSFSDGFSTQPGDVFEITAEGFGRPLRNALRKETAAMIEVASL